MTRVTFTDICVGVASPSTGPMRIPHTLRGISGRRQQEEDAVKARPQSDSPTSFLYVSRTDSV